MDWGDHSDAAWLARLLGDRPGGEGPIYRRLARALREAIAVGDLPPGARLPAERSLAERLEVSRSTVVRAYGLLEEDRLVERRQGSGTSVAGDASGRARALRPRAAMGSMVPGPRGRDTEGEAPARTPIDLALSAVDASPLVAGATAEAVGDLERGVLGNGYSALGLPALRAGIAEHLASNWGLATDPDEVLVTTGAHQAIALVAALTLRAGDAVVVENPTYVGALEAFSTTGARLVGVPLDAQGPSPEAIGRAAEASAARLAYVSPTGQNPTGALMGERRRAELARLSEERRIPLIEDNVVHDLTTRSIRPPTIASLARRAPVLTVGSFSKLFWGGLRVGWVRGPADMIARLARLKLAADHGSSMLSQAVALRLLPHVEEERTRRRRETAERLGVVASALSDLLPEWSFREPQGGLSLWARLPEADATGFCRLAREFGVEVLAGPIASADGGFDDHLRISLVGPTALLRQGVERLAEAWRAHAGGGRATRPGLHAVV